MRATASSDAPTYYVQETLAQVDPDRVGLLCPFCSLTFPAERSFIAARIGEHMGCSKCGISSRLPEVE